MEGEAWERLSRVEEESTTTVASTREETESPVRMVSLLDGELTEVHRAHEVAEQTARGLSNVGADVKRQ
jgi:hypothetical protein